MFSANGKLLRQIDGSPMGGPISVVFPDIYMCKMEFGVVVPTKSLFYKRYVDDTYVRRNRRVESINVFGYRTYRRKRVCINASF